LLQLSTPCFVLDYTPVLLDYCNESKDSILKINPFYESCLFSSKKFSAF